MAIKDIKTRKSIYQLIRAATNKYIILFLFITLYYATFWIMLLSKLTIWDWTFLKDIILWIIFIGIPICFNAITEGDELYFRDLVKNNFKFAIFIEFLVGAFTFNIVIELFLVPTSTLLLLLYTVSKIDESYKLLEKFFSFLLSMIGFIILFYAGRNAIQSYEDLNFLELLIIFSLPITMTFVFLPLSYFFALYSEYESLFIRLKFRLPKKHLSIKLKWKIFKKCNFSLKKIQFFRDNYLRKDYFALTTEELDEFFDTFKI